MLKNWVKIYVTDNLIRAEILKSVLAENEIESVIVNKQDRAYITIGEIELYTLKNKALSACQIIEKIKDE